MYSSNAEVSDIRSIENFLCKNGYKNFDVTLARPGEGATKLIWISYYNEDGQPHVREYALPIEPNSNYLKLTFAFNSEEARLNGKEDISSAVNAVRLMFGVCAARRLTLHSQYDLNNPLQGPFSEVGYASSFDVQIFNRFKDPPLEEADITKIPKEASILLEKAFSQSFPEETFILMWLAFEAIIRRFPGESNGKRREYFFNRELKSHLVNNEVIRLSKVRHSLFKEGRYSELKLESDYWSLYKAMQIATLNQCAQRQKFLKGYEQDIIERMKNDPDTRGL
jgi:hypothetical protein